MTPLSNVSKNTHLNTHIILSFCFFALYIPQTEAVTTLQDNLVITTSYPDDGVVLGQGWDMISGNKTNTICVTGLEQHIENDSSTTNYELVYDEEQLSKLLDIGAKASYGGFGYSASIESTYKKINLSERTRTHILGRVITDKGGNFLVSSIEKPIKITIPFKQESFRSICGDGFVSAIKKGGQLNVLFDIETNDTNDTEKFGIKMEAGGFGSNVGLSMSQESISKLINENTRISTIQSGGLQESPTTADEVKIKIAKFANFSPEKAAPYKILITPYNRLKDLETKNNITAMSAYYFQYQRMLSLANLYNAALIQKNSFYQPFLSEQNMKITTDFLNKTTQCMEIIISQCLNGNKNDTCVFISKNTSIDEVVAACKLDSHSVDEALKGVITNSLIPIPSQPIADRPKSTDNNFMNIILYNGISPKNITASQNARITPFDLYYMLYARAPLLKNITRSKPSAAETKTQFKEGDEALSAFQFCINTDNGCEGMSNQKEDEVQNAIMKQFIDKTPLAANTLLNWVLSVRLAPLSSTFCKLSLQHYMCATYDRLKYYLPLNVDLSEKSGFNYSLASPPPAPPERDDYPNQPIHECDWQICK